MHYYLHGSDVNESCVSVTKSSELCVVKNINQLTVYAKLVFAAFQNTLNSTVCWRTCSVTWANVPATLIGMVTEFTGSTKLCAVSWRFFVGMMPILGVCVLPHLTLRIQRSLAFRFLCT